MRVRLPVRQLILHAALVWSLAWPLQAAAAGSALSDGTVRFEVGSSQLTPVSEKVLDRLAALLKRKRDLDPIELVGHADDRGAEATNRALSLGRAKAVRQALILRGIRPSRVLVRGAGSAEPLSKADTEAARQLNRRVEVWVTSKRPVASVTRVRREVLSREAAAVQWRGAKVGQSLRRMARVRTEKASASEVTFRSKDQVQLGPEALVVIHDSPRRTRRTKTEVADVEVQQGTIFAAMASKERSLEVGTKPSRVSVRSKRTRIDVRRRRRAKAKAKAKAAGTAKAKPAADKQVSTVSVFEGRSEVAAQGRSVTVKQGYGTRVKEGEAPEAPRPLPSAPVWATANPYIGFEGEPLNLAWRRTPGVNAVEVQLGLHDDAQVHHPHRLWRVEGDSTRGGSASAGLYHLRLVGVDERDISGAPGPALKLISLPVPTDRTGAKLKVAAGRLVLKTPGPITFGALPHGTLSSTTSTSTPLRAELLRPGLHRVPFIAQVGQARVQDTLQVWVQTTTLTAQVEPAIIEGDSAHTSITFSVATGAGPVDGLQWVAGVVPEPTPRLAAVAGRPQVLNDCRCGQPPGASPVQALGEGRYRWVLKQPMPSLTSSVTVRLFAPHARIAAELSVPTGPPAGAKAQGPKASHKTGFFGGARVGALVSHSDAPTAELSAELGYRLALGRGLELDLSMEAGWLARTTEGQKVHAFPILARAALGLDLGAPRLYAGGGGGVRLLDPGPSVGGVATAFVGAGYRFGHSEVILEGAYRLVGRVPGGTEELAGWAIILGYRVGTFEVLDR